MDKMAKALAAEIERTRQELKPDPEGFREGLKTFQRRSWLLSRRLLLPMRVGLLDEAKQFFAEDGAKATLANAMRLLFEVDGEDAHMSEAVDTARIPRDEEVEVAVVELAQLLLSNWTGFIQDLSITAQQAALADLQANPQLFAPEIGAGCAAYPVSIGECKVIPAAYLVDEQTAD
jgi:hypothetical protein